MRRRCKFLGGFILVLLLILVAEGFTWAEEKKYPPYPDVWGYELPVSETVSYAGIDVIKMPDGDFMVIYTAEWRYLKNRKAKNFDISKDKIGKFAGFSFFTSKQIDFLSNDEFNNFMKNMRREKRTIKKYPKVPIVFTDRTSIKIVSETHPKYDLPFERYLERQDKDGKVMMRKKLLYVYAKP
jgi:hypothetical protein